MHRNVTNLTGSVHWVPSTRSLSYVQNYMTRLWWWACAKTHLPFINMQRKRCLEFPIYQHKHKMSPPLPKPSDWGATLLKLQWSQDLLLTSKSLSVPLLGSQTPHSERNSAQGLPQETAHFPVRAITVGHKQSLRKACVPSTEHTDQMSPVLCVSHLFR